MTPRFAYWRIPLRDLACAALVAVLLLALAAGRAAASTPPGWCTEASPPCIVSASLNGSPVFDTDPNYWLELSSFMPGGSQNFIVNVERRTGADLGAGDLSDNWIVVVNTGTMVPRVASAFGANMTYVRTPEAGGTYQMTIEGSPVHINNNSDCDFSTSIPTCPFKATSDYAAYLQIEVGEYNLPTLYTASQIPSFYGMNMWTNIDETGLPPEVLSTPSGNELVLQLADQHEYPDGSTFVGFFHLLIPDSFLEAVYGVNDPSTISTSGVAASIGSGTVTVTQPPGALEVDITGVTFTHRTLIIRRGVITPAAPRGVHARRTGTHTGRITFSPAHPRGAKVTGYEVTCKSGHSKVTATGRRSPLKIKGLRAVGYRCTVAGKSEPGLGAASAAVRLPV
jgi:hypothetical protein